jgi:O-antigen/teichoic acid export membrane protein
LRIGVIAIVSVDMVLAKWFLSPKEAGIYALLSLIGKMIYFTNQSFYSLLTPAISPYLKDAPKRRAVLVSLVVPTVLFSSILIIIILAFPQHSLALILGERYRLILPYLLPYAAASVFVSLLLLFSLYDLFRHRFWLSFTLLGALVLEVLLTLFRHQSVNQIVQNVYWSSGVALTWILITYLFRQVIAAYTPPAHR